jgi:hypothetical protein
MTEQSVNTVESKLRGKAGCFSGRVEMPNFGPWRPLAQGRDRKHITVGAAYYFVFVSLPLE